MNFVFDLDGTTVFHAQRMQDDIKHALLALERSGSNLYFATARPLRDTLPVLPECFWHHPIIGCNGAMFSQNKAVINAHSFDPAQVQILLCWLDNHEIAYLFDGLWQYAISDKPHHFHQHVAELGIPPGSNQTLRQEPIVKLLVLEDEHHDQVKQVCEQTLNNFEIYHHNGHHCFDLVPAHSNKLTALLELGLNMQQTVCFGNDVNDIAMLEAARQAYVVGEQIAPNCDFIRLTEDSVADTLRQLADEFRE
ncbi:MULTISPECIES: HAD-IIB family hydrolase [unclassified Pseudoalteromonas]|uniref:HAD-IIB family hydrolase n=1 Tax=unclassified Pseudoalteromonas TaxID=194690 RepID=UPI002096C576|nr:HAD-IIB family hydrolase [Pseudoalteromonas sp. XMcav2-N]MCO7189758.1 HAD-IIB family hydrolase [Pseudoalteromonas sp. XMcav2-N]